MVAVPDDFGPVNLIFFFIESHIDRIVDALLPVIRTRLPVGGSVRVRGWEDFFELPEFILLAVFAIWERLGVYQRCGQYQEGKNAGETGGESDNHGW